MLSFRDMTTMRTTDDGWRTDDGNHSIIRSFRRASNKLSTWLLLLRYRLS